MCISETEVSGVKVVHIRIHRIDALAAPDVRQAICDIIRGGCREFVIDLAEVDFIDSMGLGMLAGLFRLVGMNGRIVVAGATAAVQNVFRLTRMSNVFSTFATVREAVEALAPRGQGGTARPR